MTQSYFKHIVDILEKAKQRYKELIKEKPYNISEIIGVLEHGIDDALDELYKII